MVWRLDRLTRLLRERIDTVALLEGRGVGLRTLREESDTTTPSGRLVFHIFGALTEFERGLIRKRIARRTLPQPAYAGDAPPSSASAETIMRSANVERIACGFWQATLDAVRERESAARAAQR